MRVVAAAAVLLLTTTTARTAAAADKPPDAPYGTFSLGWYHPEDVGVEGTNTTVKRGDGVSVRGALGHQYHDFRAEVELGWHQGSAGVDGDSSTYSLMANAYWDADTGSAWRPYVGAGAGLAEMTFDGVQVPGLGRVNDNHLGLAWEVMAGISWQWHDDMALTLGYRWFDVPNVKVDLDGGPNIRLGDFGSHQVEVGIRYRL